MAGETIMIVEDDIISAEALRDKLNGFGYAVPPPLDNGENAVHFALETHPDLVLMDIKLSGTMDGIAAAAAIQKQIDVPVIYMTAYTDNEVLKRARITAPYSYMVKPLRDRELQITIEMVLYRHRMEKQLKEREQWLDTVLRSIGDAVLATDDNGRVNFMNAVAEDLSGWSFAEASGKPVNDILKLIDEQTGEAATNPVTRVIQEGKIVGLANHTILIAKDGTRRAIDDSAAPVRDTNGRLTGVVMVFRDISQRRGIEKELERHREHLEDLVAERTNVLTAEIAERKKAEQDRDHLEIQLRQAQKMEAIGTLAGGIAHDFNNILGIILGCTELAIMDASKTSGISEHLRQVMVAGHRASDLVQQILTFSRRQKVDKKPLRVSLVVNEVIKMLRATLPSNIEIRQQIEKNSGLTLADPAQVHQIVMNLATNSAHAMQATGGVLKLMLENVELTGDRADLASGPGSYLKLSVSDTGSGMSPDTVERIFEPYYTTKDQDEGTGLGLAVVMGIVNDYGGKVSVRSEAGQGTRFDVYLPRVPEVGRADQPEDHDTELPRGTERILFVDDELQLIKLARNMLQSLGYQVETESESRVALQRFKQNPQQFDLVISDVTMPKMTGDVLSRELLRIRPDIPIILCTGFSRRIGVEQAKSMGIQEYLIKPLRVKDLAVKVRKVLDGQTEDHGD